PSTKGWQLFHHLDSQMKIGIAEYTGLMYLQLNVLYNQTKIHFYHRCFSSHPIWDLKELQHVVRLKTHLIGLQFSFHKEVGWLPFQLVPLATYHVLFLIYVHAFSVLVMFFLF